MASTSHGWASGGHADPTGGEAARACSQRSRAELVHSAAQHRAARAAYDGGVGHGSATSFRWHGHEKEACGGRRRAYLLVWSNRIWIIHLIFIQ
jgi:hypothetical protein